MDYNPAKIEKVGNRELRIAWSDGHETAFSFRRLRQICPCAACRDEWTGARLLDPESVAKDLEAAKAQKVGNYALSFGFSDGHSSGVYTFEMLRKTCSCADCLKIGHSSIPDVDRP
jgi:DUF971 family protein